MSWKDEYIAKYGEDMYEKILARNRVWQKAHPNSAKSRRKAFGEAHPDRIKAYGAERVRKGGKYYEAVKEYKQTGLQGERSKIRIKHADHWRPYKRIIAPNSQCHHQWSPQSASYDGLALVEADRHMHGFINVIEILEGEITLLTEEEVRNGGKGK